jgi:hypothetical protein
MALMATISFPCYACNQVLKVGADKAGKRGKCPKCGTLLTIPIASVEAPPPAAPPRPAPPRAAPPPVPQPAARVKPGAPAPAPLYAEPVDDEDVPEPPRRRPRDDEEEYAAEDEDYARRRGPGFTPGARAKVGLLIVFIAFCVIAGAFACDFVVYLIGSISLIRALTGSGGGAGGPADLGNAVLFFYRAGAVLAVCGSLTAIVGYIFCMIGPNKRGSMGVAIATLVVAFIGLVLSIIFKMLPAFGESAFGGRLQSSDSPFFGWFMMLLTQLFFCAEIILFPFYTRALALSRKKYWITDASTRTMVLGVGYTIARVLGWIVILVMINMSRSSRGASPGAGKAMLWIMLILLWAGNVLYILQQIQFLLMTFRTRDIIKK